MSESSSPGDHVASVASVVSEDGAVVGRKGILSLLAQGVANVIHSNAGQNGSEQASHNGKAKIYLERLSHNEWPRRRGDEMMRDGSAACNGHHKKHVVVACPQA